MNPSLAGEIARADRLRRDSRDLYERARHALVRSQEEIARAIETATQMRRALQPASGSGSATGPVPRRPDADGVAVEAASLYTVHLEGGGFSQVKRSAAVARYRRSLEAHYRSAAAVVRALAATDPDAVERREVAMAHARWSALAPHEYAGPGAFVVRRGPGFESG